MLTAVHEYAVDSSSCRRACLLQYFGETLSPRASSAGGGSEGAGHAASAGQPAASSAGPAMGGQSRGRGAFRCCDVCDGAAHLPATQQPLLPEALLLLRALSVAGRSGSAGGGVQSGLTATKHNLAPLEAGGGLQWKWWRGLARLLVRQGWLERGSRRRLAAAGRVRRRKKRRIKVSVEEKGGGSGDDEARGGGEEVAYWLSSRGEGLLAAGPASVCGLRLWPDLDMHAAVLEGAGGFLGGRKRGDVPKTKRSGPGGWADPAERRRRLQAKAAAKVAAPVAHQGRPQQARLPFRPVPAPAAHVAPAASCPPLAARSKAVGAMVRAAHTIDLTDSPGMAGGTSVTHGGCAAAAARVKYHKEWAAAAGDSERACDEFVGDDELLLALPENIGSAGLPHVDLS